MAITRLAVRIRSVGRKDHEGRPNAAETAQRSGGGGMEWPKVVRARAYRIPLPPHKIASNQARKILEWALQDWGVHGDTADNARVVLSELVTNALTHSLDVFQMALDLRAGRILVEVWDCTDNSPTVTQPNGLAVSGRGMFLVETLSEEWGVRREKDGGKTVWARIATE